MKIYLGGSCSSENRTMMMKIATALREEGREVYCPFELKIENAWDMSQEDWARKVFNADIDAIDDADVVIVITPGRVSTAGTNWEQGYAYASGKDVLVFQITEEKTSLMTFWGCTYFCNSNAENVDKDVLYVIKRRERTGSYPPCLFMWNNFDVKFLCNLSIDFFQNFIYNIVVKKRER